MAGTSLRRVFLEDPNNSTRLAELDTITRTLIVISSAHHEVHEGKAFCTQWFDESMSNGDTIVLAFQTPAGTNRAHMVVMFSALAGGHVEIFEGATWDTNTGTQNPIFNRFRAVGMSSSGLLEDTGVSVEATDNVNRDPNNLAGGTNICPLYGFGQTARFGSEGRDLTELILKPDTQYAIRLTADGASNAGQLKLSWYEHTDN